MEPVLKKRGRKKLIKFLDKSTEVTLPFILHNEKEIAFLNIGLNKRRKLIKRVRFIVNH